MVVAATAVLVVALGGLVAPGQAALAGQYLFWPGLHVECQVHMDSIYDFDYHSSFYGVRALFVCDGMFADGDYCKLGNYYLEQHYGTLGLWKYARSPNGTILWCMCWKDSRAYNSNYSYFQGFDSNLVSYNGGGSAVGAADTCCITTPNMPILPLQSDGDLVIY